MHTSVHACPLPPPEEEQRRLAAVRRLGVLDTDPEAVFDNLVWLAAAVCDAPSSVLSLIDSDRQWFKARVGCDVTETSRELAFCAHAILGDELLYVPDTLLDDRFREHPLVVGEPHIRFYAGAPLVGQDGARYGTLCVFDSRPHDLSGMQKETLVRLARQSVSQMEMRRERLQSRARDETIANLLEALPDAVVARDAQGKVRLLNKAAQEWFGGCTHDGAPCDPAHIRMSDGSGSELAPGQFPLVRALAGDRVREEVVVQVGDQAPRILTCSAEPIRSLSGAPAGAVAILHDITAVRAAADRIAESETRMRVTLQSIADGVVAFDARGRVTFINAQATKLLQCDEPAALGQPASSLVRLVAEDTGNPVPSPVCDVIQTGRASPIRTALLVRLQGEPITVEFRATAIRGATPERCGGVLVLRDMSHTRTLAQQIQHQATHDALTGLPNRLHLETVLEALTREAQGADRNHAALLVDLDQFKIINDTCGLAAGDHLLRQVADRIRGILRTRDLLARFGGDEFAILLRDCRAPDALRIADQVRNALETMRFQWDGSPFSISASIGIVPVDGASSAGNVMSLAGSACQLAKEAGRNRIYVHQPGDSGLAQRRDELGWVSRIQSALEDDRFVLFGQRIAALAGDTPGNRIEVLLRMRETTGDLVPPMAFIPAAERYGLMQQIDRWVVDRALAAVAGSAPSAAALSINLSGGTLGDDSFLPFVEERFAAHRVPFSNVCFEVTETTAVANLAQAQKFIGWFRERGCGFSLDDFGSGMSSFGYLKRLQVDVLKIDGAFIRNLVHDEVDEAMVHAICRVAGVMKLKTVAEFVEDHATAARLKSLGVDFAQGYGIHKPEPLANLLQGRTG